MAILDPALIAAIKAVIDTEFGPAPPGTDAGLVSSYRTKLATCIAKAAQYVRDNGVVSTTDTGTVTTGVGAGGAVTATGTGTIA